MLSCFVFPPGLTGMLSMTHSRILTSSSSAPLCLFRLVLLLLFFCFVVFFTCAAAVDVYNVDHGTCIGRLCAHRDTVSFICTISPSRIATASVDGMVVIWDTIPARSGDDRMLPRALRVLNYFENVQAQHMEDPFAVHYLHAVTEVCAQPSLHAQAFCHTAINPADDSRHRLWEWIRCVRH